MCFAEQCLCIGLGCCTPMWRRGLANVALLLAFVCVVLHVLDAIEAFRCRWLSGLPSECVGLSCEFGCVALDLIWLE